MYYRSENVTGQRNSELQIYIDFPRIQSIGENFARNWYLFTMLRPRSCLSVEEKPVYRQDADVEGIQVNFSMF